jgi:hypothetical protein
MDSHKFDGIIRKFGLLHSRRQALAALAAGSLAIGSQSVGVDDAAAKKRKGKSKKYKGCICEGGECKNVKLTKNARKRVRQSTIYRSGKCPPGGQDPVCSGFSCTTYNMDTVCGPDCHCEGIPDEHADGVYHYDGLCVANDPPPDPCKDKVCDNGCTCNAETGVCDVDCPVCDYGKCPYGCVEGTYDECLEPECPYCVSGCNKQGECLCDDDYCTYGCDEYGACLED